MAIKNFTTTIEAEKTAGQVMGLLGAKGASRISMDYADGLVSGMSFILFTEYGPQEFALPVRAEGVLAAMKKDRSVPRSRCTPEQATRVAWRIARDWLDAQIALIEAGLASLDEVMLPYAIIGGRGETAYQLMRENRMKELEG